MASHVNLLQSIVYCLWLIDLGQANEHSVFRVKYYGTVSQLVTSDTLVWESFVGDEKQLGFAVKGAKYHSSEIEHPKTSFICRNPIDTVYVPGFTVSDNEKTLCLLSMSSEIHTREKFDILINKAHGAKVVWAKWSKFDGRLPNGTISASNAGHLEDQLVARYKNEHYSTDEHHAGHGWDHFVGRFDPTFGLGRISVTNGKKIFDYENGEVLAEVEPLRYELRQIQLDKWRTRNDRNQTVLASTVLKNENSVADNLVETVVTYEYRKENYWGKLEGVASGLPVDVFETDDPYRLTWGIDYKEVILETKTISIQLPPNTAVNVTVIGNYTDMRAPYHATLLAFYADNSDAIRRKINGNVRKAYLQDVEIVYGSIFWLNNGTIIPTTTPPSITTSLADIETNESSKIEKTKVSQHNTRLILENSNSDTSRSIAPSFLHIFSASYVMLVAVLTINVMHQVYV